MAAAAASAAALDPSNSTKNTLKLENVEPSPPLPSLVQTFCGNVLANGIRPPD